MTGFTHPPPPLEDCIRVVLIGDIVGKPGMRIACASVAWLRGELKCDVVLANAENAADGSGVRCKDYRRLIDHGVDAITLGDHLYRKREIIKTLEEQANIIRPANLPLTAPGKSTMVLHTSEGVPVAVTSVLGRVFMRPVDCPFSAVDRELKQLPEEVRVRVVDLHAEATSDMQLMGRYLDGRVTAVLGTHTHVATADECIFPGGTAFQCDVGMSGPFESILGRKIDAVMEATLHAIPTPFQVATQDVRLNATWFDAEIASGKCRQLGRINVAESVVDAYHRQQSERQKLL